MCGIVIPLQIDPTSSSSLRYFEARFHISHLAKFHATGSTHLGAITKLLFVLPRLPFMVYPQLCHIWWKPRRILIQSYKFIFYFNCVIFVIACGGIVML